MLSPSEIISVNSSSDSNLEIVERWDQKLRQTRLFKAAYEILRGKAHGSPNIAKMVGGHLWS